MRSKILAGLRNNEFHLVYQPQMTADGSSAMSIEALVRWTTAEGPVPLDIFLKAAEENGSIVELGEAILERACLDALNWPRLRVAVNVSAVQIRELNFPQRVEQIVRSTGLPFHRLEIELVESVFIENFEQARTTLNYFRSLGITIALDDFGTGYSSLTYLCKLPLDKIKIDRSFITNIDKVSSAAIVQAIVALARALGLKVTAEGVETQEQQRFLKACGVHFLQGYLFSKPVPAEAISALLSPVKAA